MGFSKTSKGSVESSKAENLKKRERERDGELEGRKKDGKSKKKKAKLKQPKESASSSPEKLQKSPLESTVTPQGQIMAQVLSTFNRLEQSRFEAFRRSAFSSDAVSKYVAQCLIERHHPTTTTTTNNNNNNNNNNSHTGLQQQQPILSHLTAPGQANEITIIVSTLAKVYAQRLITSARRFVSNNDQSVEPEHILQAFEERRSQGLDPGLFLQPQQSSSLTTTTNLTLDDGSFQRRRLVALELQDMYDRNKNGGNEQQSEKEKEEKEKEDSMEIES